MNVSDKIQVTFSDSLKLLNWINLLEFIDLGSRFDDFITHL